MTKQEARDREERISALISSIEQGNLIVAAEKYEHGQQLVSKVKDNINVIYTRE